MLGTKLLAHDEAIGRTLITCRIAASGVGLDTPIQKHSQPDNIKNDNQFLYTGFKSPSIINVV